MPKTNIVETITRELLEGILSVEAVVAHFNHLVLASMKEPCNV